MYKSQKSNRNFMNFITATNLYMTRLCSTGTTWGMGGVCHFVKLWTSSRCSKTCIGYLQQETNILCLLWARKKKKTTYVQQEYWFRCSGILAARSIKAEKHWTYWLGFVLVKYKMAAVKLLLHGGENIIMVKEKKKCSCNIVFSFHKYTFIPDRNPSVGGKIMEQAWEYQHRLR